MKPGQIRQGDVLLVPVNETPPIGAQTVSEVIMAYGETTGHAHRLAAPTVLTWEAAGQRYVRVIGDAPGTISHEDHDPTPAAVVVPGMTYQVVPQRVFDLTSQWRKVRD